MCFYRPCLRYAALRSVSAGASLVKRGRGLTGGDRALLPGRHTLHLEIHLGTYDGPVGATFPGQAQGLDVGLPGGPAAVYRFFGGV